MDMPKISAAVLTVSDKGAAGTREDLSGPAVMQVLSEIRAAVEHADIVPDEWGAIRTKLIDYCDNKKIDLVLTTGGTGVAPRDITPDVTRDVIEKEVPGMAEAMRRESLKKTPHAVISRAIAGIRGTTLIINLPGSPKGASENLQSILKALPHAVMKINGDPSECAAES